MVRPRFSGSRRRRGGWNGGQGNGERERPHDGGDGFGDQRSSIKTFYTGWSFTLTQLLS